MFLHPTLAFSCQKVHICNLSQFQCQMSENRLFLRNHWCFYTHSFGMGKPQICTFWHEKAGVLCRNINHYTKTNCPHSFGMGKAANMYFLTWKGRCFMQKHQTLRKNKLFSHIWHGNGRKYVLSEMKRPVFYAETSIITQKQTLFTHLTWKRPQICTF